MKRVRTDSLQVLALAEAVLGGDLKLHELERLERVCTTLAERKREEVRTATFRYAKTLMPNLWDLHLEVGKASGRERIHYVLDLNVLQLESRYWDVEAPPPRAPGGDGVNLVPYAVHGKVVTFLVNERAK